MTAALSVIIPCLNEAETLPALLADLAAQRGVILETLVADGGSTDASIAIARAAGAQVIPSPPGRARQMNGAASAGRGEWLLFLHADSRLHDAALLANAIAALRQQPVNTAGHFALRFIRCDSSHALAWRYVEEKTAFNRRYCANGDQGLLIRRSYFFELGGFDERLPFLEDQRIVARIHDTGYLITLPGLLQTSARRFEQTGFHRQYLLMALIMAMQAAGLERFFEQARGLYRAPHESGRLPLWPFFELARRCAAEAGRWKSWRAIGRLGRENWWQLFYFVDVALGPWLGAGRYPVLRFYERAIEPFTDNRLCDAFAAGVLWLHFHLIVRPWIWLADRRQTTR